MASYVFTTFDGTTRQFIIDDFEIDTTQAPVKITGRGAPNYGTAIAQDLVYLTENFANSTATALNALKPLRGQTYFNTTEGKLKVNVSANPNIPDWRNIGTTVTLATSQPASPNAGDFWVNSTTQTLNVWTGGSFIVPSVMGSASTINFAFTIGAVNLSLVIVNGKLVGVWSDGTIPAISVPNTITINGNIIDFQSEFPSGIGPGLNMTTSTDFKFHGQISSSYADLAERYESNEYLDAGTLVEMGGEKEIQKTQKAMTSDVFGVISYRAALEMNAGAGSNHTHPFVAVSGRVPVKTIGKVKKGQRLAASAIKGVAMAVDITDSWVNSFAIFGRAFEDKNTDDIGMVGVTVGLK